MAGAAENGLEELERQRLKLESHIASLRRSLRYWQTWEAEYEGFKEEIEPLAATVTSEDMLRWTADFGSELLNETEIKDVLGLSKGQKRSKEQVLRLLHHRIEYVHNNAKSVQKQLDADLEQLDDNPATEKPENETGKAIPAADIQEELDDVGHVISGRVLHPDDTSPKVIESLKNAGIQEGDLTQSAPLEGSSEVQSSAQTQSTDFLPTESDQDRGNSDLSSASDQGGHVRNESAHKLPPNNPEAFAEGTKREQSSTTVPLHPGGMHEQSSLAELARGSFKPGDRVVELDENDRPISSIKLPSYQDESPQDAALRREIVQYGLSDVGSVVAQLDLEDTGEDNSDFDYYGSDDDYDSPGSLDEENQYGMNTGRGMDDKYLKEMLALEEKLNARAMQNLGPQPLPNSVAESATSGPGSVTRTEPGLSREPQGNTKTNARDKTVRFAEELDIVPPSSSLSPNQPPSGQQSRYSTAVEDLVVERSSLQDSTTTNSQPRKVSRFKSSRLAQNRHHPAVTSGITTSEAASPSEISSAAVLRQDNSTADGANSSSTPAAPLSEQVFERRTPTSNKVMHDPPDLDASFQERQLATAYYRERNRLVQKQGGFVKVNREVEAEREEISGDEYEEGDKDENSAPGVGRQKVSLFTAARLRRNDAL